MAKRVWIDFETRSYADLKKVGVYCYAEHPSTGIVCLCYRIDDGPTRYWVPLEAFLDWSDEANWTPWNDKHSNINFRALRSDVPKTFMGMRREAYGFFSCEGPGRTSHMPPDLMVAIHSGAAVEAHNMAFEYCIWSKVMVDRYGWCRIRDEQWEDSMAAASYFAMPAGLDALARALGYEGKDPAGTKLISRYSKLTLKTAKTIIPAEDVEAFVVYCDKDVQVEQAVSEDLGEIPDSEMELFRLDFRMNMRGLGLDLAGIEAAAEVVDKRSEELTTKFHDITGLSPTQTKKLLPWFEANGLKLESMRAEYLEDLLEDDAAGVPQGPARTALELRLAVSKASTKKLDAMARQAGSDSRARFQSRYHGAMSGRPTGAGFQPLNLKRGYEDLDPEQLVRDIMYRNPRWLDAVYEGGAMEAVAKASRHWIQAASGHRILAGDLVSIEAVLLACLAGEDWKVDAFRTGKKIYELMGDKIHNLPDGTVTKKTHPAERQDGKTGELAFGYQGALNAWLKFDNSGRHTDERIIEICKAWRAEHPMVTALWKGLEAAALSAVYSDVDAATGRGQEFTYRQIAYQRIDSWLACTLPDGKRIWYYDPQIRMGMPSWHQPDLHEACASGDCRCKPVPKITYMAMKAGQWRRVSTYGGKLTENVTQATSRQVLVPIIKRVERHGYPIVLTVYDEVVTEPKIGFGAKAEFEELMVESPGAWAFIDGKPWPIRVDAWEGDRYKK